MDLYATRVSFYLLRFPFLLKILSYFTFIFCHFAPSCIVLLTKKLPTISLIFILVLSFLQVNIHESFTSERSFTSEASEC